MKARIEVNLMTARMLQVACRLRAEACAENNELSERQRWLALQYKCERAEKRLSAKGKKK